MKSPRSNKKILLLVVTIVLALLILKIVLVLTAKPKITVDYVAEYNRMTLPENYDPSDNAAEPYQKAFDAFTERPMELWNPYKNWPSDFNSAEYAKLESWLASNAQAFKYFKLAASNPYYWLERRSTQDNNLIGILLPELSTMRKLTRALSWNAKFSAFKGRPAAAFDDILDCYRAGYQKCRTPSFLIDQMVGMDVKEVAVEDALIILANTHIDSSDLKIFQDALQKVFDNDIYVPDFEAERLLCYDELQRTFVDNGRGTGRLAFRKIKDFLALCDEEYNRKVPLSCFIGPTRKQITQQIEKISTIFNQIMTKSPWQIKNEGYGYFEEITKIEGSNFFFECLLSKPNNIFHFYHKQKSQTKALITVLAILRFKADNHRLPAALVELTDKGYLQYFPMDPYSNTSLVYKPAGDNFKLYSVGRNFSDDGGTSEPATKQVADPTGRTHTYNCGYLLDIVYWPVEKSKDPRKK